MHAFRDEMMKIAVTRSVKEWRAANAAGDQGTAGQIAQASGQLGLKPRYLHDISQGGEEAGVDKMMGHVQTPNTGARNESGLLARKMYKPDSIVSQAEFTPQLLQQKQQLTDTARAISPQAKGMVPDMYGHSTTGAGTPLQRTTSYHELVPGVSDLRALPREQTAKSISDVRSTVLKPMEQKGMDMGDTAYHGDNGKMNVNYGNVVNSASGPKVLDFLPVAQPHGDTPGTTPAIESMKKYAPIYGGSKFSGEGAAPLSALRKEVFKPTMQSNEASFMDRVQAHAAVGHVMPTLPSGQTPPGRMAMNMPAARPAAPAGELRTGAASPQARAASAPPAANATRTGAASPMARAAEAPVAGPTTNFLRGAGTATKGFFGRAASHL
jgi:hypothetical protein